MRIDGTDPFGRLKRLLTQLDEPEKAERGGKSAETEKKSTAPAAPKDGMKISPEALELQRLRDEIFNRPDVRQEVVDQLKDEIRSGRYNIDGTRLADALLREERQEAEALAVRAEKSRLDREA